MAKETIQCKELLDIARSMKEQNELFYFFLRACENANLQVCQICLDAGADVNSCEDYYKYTLLNKLVESGKFTAKVGDWLIEKGADINGAGYGGSNLTLACKHGNFYAAKYFIDKDIEIQYGGYGSDLYRAIEGRNYAIVKMLLDLDLDLKFDKIDAFIKAVKEKLSKIVELFLQNNDVSPNFYTDDELTPLHMAVIFGDIETANILLKYHASINAKLKGKAMLREDDDLVLTPMDIAIHKKNMDMQKLLADFGGTVSTKEEKIQALTECEDKEKAFWAMKKLLAL